jgi:hypothetical protein
MANHFETLPTLTKPVRARTVRSFDLTQGTNASELQAGQPKFKP